jgi:hypothetical protein
MLDRIDIDALLIGSLYGELSAADEARLHAHLESHPADRSALADFGRVRAALKASRILEIQLEPPQSVSALLMQEAARRAPKATVAEEKTEGWFQRFVRSFATHPAMAAAAMLVLVMGVAGLLYLKNDPYVEKTAEVTPTQPQLTVGTGSTATVETPPAVTAPADQAAAADRGQATDPDSKLAKQSDVTSGSYRVELAGDDSLKSRPPTAQPKAPPPTTATAPAKKSSDHGYLEVKTAKPSVKEMEDEETGAVKAGTATATANRELAPSSQALDTNERQDRSAEGRAKNGAPAAGAAAGGAGFGSASPSTRDGKDVSKDVRAPAPPPAPPVSVDKTDAPRVVEDVAWARGQHSKVLEAAKSNDCRSAASYAVTLQTRAPSYYAQNVENDRTLKPCLAYIAQQRDADAERARARAGEKRPADRKADEPAKTKPTAVDRK